MYDLIVYWMWQEIAIRLVREVILNYEYLGVYKAAWKEGIRQGREQRLGKES
jgi:hypothetical protein